MRDKFGLDDNTLDIVLSLLHKYTTISKVVIFGSRVKGTYKATSDIDLAIWHESDAAVISLLHNDLEESTIPYFFDLVDYATITNDKLRYTIDTDGKIFYLRGWEVKKLGDVANIVMGQSPKGENCSTKNIGLPLLNGPTEFTYRHPIPTQFTSQITKTSNIGDILFCVRGSTTGKMNWSDQNYVIGRGIAAISHKSDINLNYFIRGVLEHNLNDILSAATGSTFPNVSKDLLDSLLINIPPLQIQKQIEDILSTLDNKINLLQEQNKILEELAQTIFKQWFIDFNFPDENGKPYKDSGGAMVDSELGETPINWRIVDLGSLVTLNKGKSYKSSELSTSGLPMVNLKCFGIDYEFKHSGIKYFTGSYKNNHIVKGGDLVISMTDVTQNADIVANILTIPNYLKEAIISLDVSSIKSKNNNITNSFLYYLLKTNTFREFAKSYTSGTTVLHLNKNGILNYRFALPNDTILDKITRTLHCIITQKDKNTALHKTLVAIRDALLPKLMSGEIKV